MTARAGGKPAPAPPASEAKPNLPQAVINWIAQVLARYNKEQSEKDKAA